MIEFSLRLRLTFAQGAQVGRPLPLLGRSVQRNLPGQWEKKLHVQHRDRKSGHFCIDRDVHLRDLRWFQDRISIVFGRPAASCSFTAHFGQCARCAWVLNYKSCKITFVFMCTCCFCVCRDCFPLPLHFMLIHTCSGVYYHWYVSFTYMNDSWYGPILYFPLRHSPSFS